MLPRAFFVSSLLTTSLVSGQGVGSYQSETHPKMTWQQCSGTGGSSCKSVSGEVVIDANWRWLHVKGDYTNCYDGNKWNTTLCSSNDKCSTSCVVEGADYPATYGITASGNALTLKFVTKGSYSTNIGSRTYLMKDTNTYQTFNLIGNEFTFDVDVSQLPCGLNGALYFVVMDAKGQGTAGAKYGTGYCDGQCPRDLKFINGKANAVGWQPSSNDQNAGVGERGSCCAEMDVWEANSISTALTPHSCDSATFVECSGDNCGGTYSGTRYSGPCDANGCDFNPYRLGVTDFYGKGKTVDTSKPFTVVTQFLGSGTTLSEIKRYYVQGSKVIENPQPKTPGITGNSITQAWCDAENAANKEEVYPFKDHGGMQSMANGMAKGMVLVMSLWDDHYANMLWLDSTYPTDADASTPGAARGDCATSSGVPADVESKNGNAQVKYSNIKFGPIGSTFKQP
ncbi:glycoside hydrolase family 7 protein [Melanomma pulvis-pyrius CBS 109.77]|uniref:Glucanase n=1 Tax=Melanomma pulvis-pyrius CBS 109.77 TaxID=1314802 RepID=A0A6A6XCM3_9PLEO|nr:glycoside hydrolase family 7 protein [Melanomma pulvis-pyrius CBS 109.77]